MLGVCWSSHYADKARRRRPDGKRLRLRAKVTELFNASRGAEGSRTLRDQMRLPGSPLGASRFVALCVRPVCSLGSLDRAPIRYMARLEWISPIYWTVSSTFPRLTECGAEISPTFGQEVVGTT